LPLNNKHIKVHNTFGRINKNGREKQIKIVFRARENDLLLPNVSQSVKFSSQRLGQIGQINQRSQITKTATTFSPTFQTKQLQALTYNQCMSVV